VKSAGTLEKFARSLLRKQGKSPPDMLWHYTNATGLLGILKSGKLWATNTEYLNDASELRYARHLVWQSINKMRSKTMGSREDDVLDILAESIGRRLNRPVFVVSLSAEKDELSQWRAYGTGSGSFALGFSSRVLTNAISNATSPSFNLYKCIYDTNRSSSICQRFVEKALVDFRTYLTKNPIGPSDFLEIRNFVSDAIEQFETIAPLIKHPDFAEEAEWRLVSGAVDLNTRPIHLREGKTCIVPFIDFVISKDKSLPKVTVHTQIGPAISYHPADTTHVLIAYSDDFILQPFPVEPSNTPFRHR
jgi:hypothetical protein